MRPYELPFPAWSGVDEWSVGERTRRTELHWTTTTR